ncbi:MAG: metallophosphoesterase family protein [Flavobacteriaceae bacterium]|nr:metallophosphoesterase family protein [Flavobacteriaceae bacterium]
MEVKKAFKILGIIALGLLLVAYNLNSPEQDNSHTHESGSTDGHSHYSNHLNTDGHKLIFPSRTPDRIITNLTAVPESSFAVNWRTNQQIELGVLQVTLATDGPEFIMDGVRTIDATTESFENKNRNEPLVKANFHSVLVKGLKANTTYVYRVGNGDTESDKLWSEWFQFTTARDASSEEPFSFIYFGDAQNHVKSMWSRVIRNSYKKFPEVDFMLHAGDLIESRDANLEWGEWFYAGSFIHATVPSMMTPGNHEYVKKPSPALSTLWRPQFTLPKNGPSEILSETSYVIDYQNLKMISVDAPALMIEDIDASIQVKWLDSVLANNTKKWTAITLHYPIFSTKTNRDNKELRDMLKPLIDKYKVDLVLQGHDHTYARGEVSNNTSGETITDDAGTIYAVSVSGPKMYESKDGKWMERRGEYTQLFQIITIGKDSLSYEAYTPIGNLYDAFDLIKKDGKKKLVNRVPETSQRFKKDFIKE